jgi:hypothetical protein
MGGAGQKCWLIDTFLSSGRLTTSRFYGTFGLSARIKSYELYGYSLQAIPKETTAVWVGRFGLRDCKSQPPDGGWLF